VIVETVFSWPGMGRLLYDAIMNKDVNLAMACLLLLGLLTVSGSLLADIAYAVVDPRVRYGQGR
jgi:peptide/nickel transport system permease protein